MFIVWGKTIKRQKLGFVADYCSVCRDLRTFQVKRIGSASHVYYISFGEGDLVGYERICGVCSTPFETAPDTYSGMSKDSRPATELVSETFPNYYKVYDDVIARERKVRDTPSLLTPAERKARMREPFVIIAPLAQQKLSSIQVDWRVVAAVFSFLPIFWALGAVAKLTNGPYQDDPSPSFMIAGLALWAGLIIWQIVMSSRRYLQKHAVPPIAAALAPLKPTESEINRVIEELKVAKLKLARIRAADLLERIEFLRTNV